MIQSSHPSALKLTKNLCLQQADVVGLQSSGVLRRRRRELLESVWITMNGRCWTTCCCCSLLFLSCSSSSTNRLLLFFLFFRFFFFFFFFWSSSSSSDDDGSVWWGTTKSTGWTLEPHPEQSTSKRNLCWLLLDEVLNHFWTPSVMLIFIQPLCWIVTFWEANNNSFQFYIFSKTSFAQWW